MPDERMLSDSCRVLAATTFKKTYAVDTWKGL